MTGKIKRFLNKTITTPPKTINFTGQRFAQINTTNVHPRYILLLLLAAQFCRILNSTASNMAFEMHNSIAALTFASDYR